MPLIPGSVTVTAGISAGTGLAKELYDARRAAASIPELPIYDTGLKALASDCSVIATTVIAHFIAHALVSTNDTGTVAAGIPVATTGTAAAQAGATTATGLVTATGTGTIS